jgi:hypothetical protein
MYGIEPTDALMRVTSRRSCRTPSKAGSNPVASSRVIGLDEVHNGYRAMNEREAIKTMIGL